MEGGAFFSEIKKLLSRYWLEKSGGKDELYTFSLRLAASQVKVCPFDENCINEGLKIMEKHFGLGAPDFEVQPRQCFRLKALSGVLKAFGDPDWAFPLGLVGGVPVGVDGSLPRAEAIYEAKVRWSLGEGTGEPEQDRQNYKSMKGFEDQVEALFREEEALGWMEEMPEEEARKRFGNRLFVSSLAVVDEGEKIRVVHDATHGVELNNRIRVLDQVRYPRSGGG